MKNANEEGEPWFPLQPPPLILTLYVSIRSTSERKGLKVSEDA